MHWYKAGGMCNLAHPMQVQAMETNLIDHYGSPKHSLFHPTDLGVDGPDSGVKLNMCDTPPLRDPRMFHAPAGVHPIPESGEVTSDLGECLLQVLALVVQDRDLGRYPPMVPQAPRAL